MLRRLSLIGCLIAIGLSLGGCTRCGFIWDDKPNVPKSCLPDLPKG